MATSCNDHARYQTGCEGCKLSDAEYSRNRRRQQMYGRWHPFADLHAVRAHIAYLVSRNVTCAAIAEVAGTRRKTVSCIHNGSTTRVTADLGRRILAVKVAGNQRLVPPVGGARRIQALAAIGYTNTEIAGRVGVAARQVYMWAHCRVALAAENFRRLVEVYDELAMRPVDDSPAARYARSVARRNGWVPPLAWDDDDIDNADARPQTPATDRSATYDESRVIQACAGQVTYDEMWPAERAEAVRRLNAADQTDGEIAEILRADHKTVGKRRIRMGLPSRYDPASYLGRAS